MEELKEMKTRDLKQADEIEISLIHDIIDSYSDLFRIIENITSKKHKNEYADKAFNEAHKKISTLRDIRATLNNETIDYFLIGDSCIKLLENIVNNCIPEEGQKTSFTLDSNEYGILFNNIKAVVEKTSYLFKFYDNKVNEKNNIIKTTKEETRNKAQDDSQNKTEYIIQITPYDSENIHNKYHDLEVSLKKIYDELQKATHAIATKTKTLDGITGPKFISNLSDLLYKLADDTSILGLAQRNNITFTEAEKIYLELHDKKAFKDLSENDKNNIIKEVYLERYPGTKELQPTIIVQIHSELMKNQVLYRKVIKLMAIKAIKEMSSMGITRFARNNHFTGNLQGLDSKKGTGTTCVKK